MTFSTILATKTEIRVIRDQVTMTYRKHLVPFDETPKTIHMRELASKSGLVPETAQPLPLILTDFCAVVPEFKNLSLSEPTGSLNKKTNEVFIEIPDQSKDFGGFGSDHKTRKSDLDVQEVLDFELSEISDETGRSNSDSHLTKMKGHFYQSVKH
jgi:hypothetical protein